MRAFLIALLALLLAACEIGPSATPATPAPAPTITPLPTALPPPAGDLLARGKELRELGDYDAAAERFFTLVAAYPNDARAREASYYLAESYALRDRWASALAALEPLTQQPDDAIGARALFMLARAYEQTGASAQAIETYERYRSLQTPIAAYAQIRQADQERALGRLAAAAANYESVASQPIARGERALALEHAAQVWSMQERPAEALRVYTTLLELAELPAYRAHVLLAAADAAEASGDSQRRLDWLHEIVEVTPGSPEAAPAADRLLGDGAIDPVLAAAIFVGAERWDDAIAQYDAAIAGAESGDRLNLRRLRALALREGVTPDFPTALAELDALLFESDPASDLAGLLRLDRIQTLGQSGDLAGAITAYRALATELPDDARAPEALRRAAILIERTGDATQATELRLELIRRYPDSEPAQELLFTTALPLYRSGRTTDAIDLWERQIHQNSGIVAAQGAYWAGRAYHDLGQPELGDPLFEQAATLAPDSYYAARAADRRGLAERGMIEPMASIGAGDWDALNDWVNQWAAPLSTDEPAPTSASVALEGAVTRAHALDAVALWAEARAEWRLAADLWRNDPRHLAILAGLVYQDGEYGIAREIAGSLLALAPAEQHTAAPIILRRLLFPAPYAEALLPIAREHHVDPLLVYALILQESAFHSHLVSSAGARGLAQIMPSTGAGIAQRLGIAEFRDTDLDRPMIAISFGAYYLGEQIRRNDGNVYAALAGYNGGPANAQRWAAASGVSDPDLFVESIDFGETRAYVKLVYGNYGAYRRLYAPPKE